MGVIGNQGFWAFSETKGCFGGRKPKLVGVIDKKGLWAWKKPRVVGVIGTQTSLAWQDTKAFGRG